MKGVNVLLDRRRRVKQREDAIAHSPRKSVEAFILADHCNF